MRRNMRIENKIDYSNLVLILCMEFVLSLMVRSFVWGQEYGFYELEMIRSFIRVVSGLFYLWLMKDLVYSGRFPSKIGFPHIVVPALFMLFPPFLSLILVFLVTLASHYFFALQGYLLLLRRRYFSSELSKMDFLRGFH